MALVCSTRGAYSDHMVTYSALVIRRVEAAMKAAGETRLGLAEKTGIARPTLKRSLDGHRPFNTDELGRIAAALGVEIADLVHPKAAA